MDGSASKITDEGKRVSELQTALDAAKSEIAALKARFRQQARLDKGDCSHALTREPAESIDALGDLEPVALPTEVLLMISGYLALGWRSLLNSQNRAAPYTHFFFLASTSRSTLAVFTMPLPESWETKMNAVLLFLLD